MKAKILWVDDEKALLDSMQRHFRGKFRIVAATGGVEGLSILRKDKEFPVIISDLKMPIMSGIEFLSEARKLAPDSVRLMFTGFAGLDSAIKAVNEGHIFRFLTKPMEMDLIERHIIAGLRQYELIQAEHELLDKTLTGSLQVLLDVLALASPTAFNRSARIRDTVDSLATDLHLPDRWALQTAASFYHLGYITLPNSTLEKIYTQRELDEEDQKMLNKQADLAVAILSKIPRMEKVTGILSAPVLRADAMEIQSRHEPAFSAHVLHAAVEWDALLARGIPP